MIVRSAVEPGALGGSRHMATSPIPQRINVAINSDMLAAIDRVIEGERVTLTEAVRRLITYGDFLNRSSVDGRATIVLITARDPGPDVERRVTPGDHAEFEDPASPP